MNTTLPLRYRSIFISDVHLGFKACRADYLLDFLRSTESEHLFLVGDIIDFWKGRKGMYWPQSHNDVLRELLAKARNGTRVTYVPGNHDEVGRELAGMQFGNIAVRRDVVHEAADGRRYWVLHGDEMDTAVRCDSLVEVFGDAAYDGLLAANRYLNRLRRLLGLPYWSLADFTKRSLRNAARYVARFEDAVAREAARRGVDGVVCGHIHRAEVTELHGITYCNDGDWVESCTALVEHHDGSMELVHWSDRRHSVKQVEALGGLTPRAA
jgi:UDP-2,3-diacylglucosamine pyrophosphatase LpxH